jgi:hypothetical protein
VGRIWPSVLAALVWALKRWCRAHRPHCPCPEAGVPATAGWEGWLAPSPLPMASSGDRTAERDHGFSVFMGLGLDARSTSLVAAGGEIFSQSVPFLCKWRWLSTAGGGFRYRWPLCPLRTPEIRFPLNHGLFAVSSLAKKGRLNLNCFSSPSLSPLVPFLELH